MAEIKAECKRSERWIYKWRKRYKQSGWAGLHSQSTAPKKHGTRYSDRMRQVIQEARSKLEAGQASTTELKYVGGQAIRTELKGKKLRKMPSRATIERVIGEAKMSRPKEAAIEVEYPHLKASQPYQLVQVDIVPHYLRGGTRAACFNAIDVYSKYPTGKAYPHRRSLEAAKFLIWVWQEIGLPAYTQVDNEGCFSGGTSHPNVLGKVVRLALSVGTQLLFSPVYHPKSNSHIERFHQDYNLHVWQDTYLADFKQLNRQAKKFFRAYRHSTHHSALKGQTPHQVHAQDPGVKLKSTFRLPKTKQPLYAGQLHFLRRVDPQNQVSVLNQLWAVPDASSDQGVWVTIDFQPSQSTLSIYDQPPGWPNRHCLHTHIFPLSEPVLPISNRRLSRIYVNQNSA